jgi:hypothetical protein
VQSTTPPSDASTIPPAPPFSKYLPTCSWKVICRFIAAVTTMTSAIDNALFAIKEREVLIISDGDPAVYV